MQYSEEDGGGVPVTRDQMYWRRMTIETDFGPLSFEPGDYLVVPRSVTYRVLPSTTDNFFLMIQSRSEFNPPEKGLIGQHATVQGQ